jgi:hypothetical protein
LVKKIPKEFGDYFGLIRPMDGDLRGRVRAGGHVFILKPNKTPRSPLLDDFWFIINPLHIDDQRLS